MWRTRTINPLGIRKLDVQAERRAARREHKAQAESRFELWFGKKGLDKQYPPSMPMTREHVIRFAEVMLSDGWEQGVTVGAKATRGRVAEALERGTLVKP